MSSLSGFSTNSHLDDAVEESIATREGEGTNKPTPDPFAAFSILSGGSGDPFGGQSFGGRPSDLSSFDPFGGAPGGGGSGGSGDGGSNFEAFKVFGHMSHNYLSYLTYLISQGLPPLLPPLEKICSEVTHSLGQIM